MDWVIAVSRPEAASGALLGETESAALTAFREHGCILLRGALPVAAVEAMHADYVAQFGQMGAAQMAAEVAKPAPNRVINVGADRYDIGLPMTGAFGCTDVFGNPILLKILRKLIGRNLHLINFTTVVSYPGTPQQRPHRDYPHLFDHVDVGPDLPIYAINVAVPLIDVDLETGPTGVWLGSHRMTRNAAVKDADMKQCAFKRGDCMLLDYRVLHAGLANRSQGARPIVYMVYALPWFFDESNHSKRVPVDMPIDDYERLPPALRPVLSRAYSYASRSRWHEIDVPQAHQLPAEPKVAPRVATMSAPMMTPVARPPASRIGRNDPCTCGSGKKFKQCHGAFTAA